MTDTKPHAATVAEAVQRAQAERQRAYIAAVRATAEGREVDPEQVAELLDRLGIDVEKFTADAEAVAARIATDKALKEVPALHARRAQIEAERAALVRELEKIQAEYGERITKLYRAAGELAEDARKREAAWRRAFEVCPYPGVQEARDRASSEAQRLRTQVRDLEDIRAEWVAFSRREPPGNLSAGDRAKGLNEIAARAKIEIEKVDVTLAERRGELADAEAELARAEAELNRP